MAALCGLTILVEASKESGTRHQVKACADLGRRLGVLVSLEKRKLPWVKQALEGKGAFVISGVEDILDAIAALPDAPQQMPPMPLQGQLFDEKLLA